MKWIHSADLKNWAGTRNCQEILPEVVRRLIRATTDSVNKIKFPSGDNVLIGGWDGILDISKATEYVPSGTSLWEFGADKNVRQKAEKEYKKRTANPLGYKTKSSTFIFVTPRLWTKSDDWIKEKAKEKKWKQIIVINLEILEEWLEMAPSVSAWLAIEHIKKYPPGVQSAEDFWHRWSKGPGITLSTEILLSGREKEKNRLFQYLSQPSIIPIKETSREDALAFAIGCLKSEEKDNGLISRSLIVQNIETFNQVSVLKTPLILFALFPEPNSLNHAIELGHTVIVPLGNDSSDQWTNEIKLPKIDRNGFIGALMACGLSEDLAEKHSRESTRNLTILRRRLKFNANIPEWARAENVREIIPAILVGGWNENNEEDKIALSKLAGEDYNEYLKKINRWRFHQDAPIVKIGSTWKLISPFDAWSNASRNITNFDFELLKSIFLTIYKETDPVLDLAPENRFLALLNEKKKKYSSVIKDGCIESLILISLYSDQFNIDLSINGQIWVDNIIDELLKSEDPILWKSIESQLPKIAEASPNSFIKSIEKHLAVENSPIVKLFEETPGFITTQSYHTGLLWALEGIAWLPEYLSKATLILGKLSVIDPGGNTSNRPYNSLYEIFKPWHYQTLACLEDRVAVLKLLIKKEVKIATDLLIRMLPDPNGVGSYNYKMRWRMPDESINEVISYEEIHKTHSTIIDLVLDICNFSEAILAEVIKKSSSLNLTNRNRLFVYLEKNVIHIKQIDFSIWNEVRKILSWNRSHSTSSWALSSKELEPYDRLNILFQPKDELNKVIWLFNENYPSFPEGLERNGKTHEEIQQFIDSQRINGLKLILEKFGEGKIIELCDNVKEVSILGSTLASILEKEERVFDIYVLLINQTNKNVLKFINGFIFRQSVSKGSEYILKKYRKLKLEGVDNTTLSSILLFSCISKELWEFIELESEEIHCLYWTKVQLWMYGLKGKEIQLVIRNFIKHNKLFSAIKICSIYSKELTSELLVEALTKAVSQNVSENNQLESYDIENLFETLNTRNDISHKIMVDLEWSYLPVLAKSSYGNQNIKSLCNELSSNPSFFVEVVRWAYKPNDNTLLEMEKKQFSDKQFYNRAGTAYDLLEFYKTIPGTNDNGKIDSKYLNTWIDEVRELAAKVSREAVVDRILGKLLSMCHRNKDSWPPTEISEVIERINTKELKQNFYFGIVNSRGAHSKSHFEGGRQEHEIAEYYKSISLKHRNIFPNVSEIFNDLAISYEQQAKQEDERAEGAKLEY